MARNTDKITRFVVDLPEGLSRDERLLIADEIIEYVVDRTQRGKDKNGDKFAPYSPEYKKSLAFAIAGKSKSKVDLQLSGDMLAAMNLIKETKKKLVIGIDDPEVQGRAEGNILGTYGQAKPVTKPRDFMGIEPDKLERIIKKYAPDAEL